MVSLVVPAGAGLVAHSRPGWCSACTARGSGATGRGSAALHRGGGACS